MRKKVSIVIVHYKVIEHLLNCIDTIKKFTKKITYEIIVIDNDEVKRLDTILTKRHPDIKYISNNNQGFGDGVNTGASIAKGSYLFVLNPDTLLTNNCLDSLVEYADTHKKSRNYCSCIT